MCAISLCISANEDHGILAEYDPFTEELAVVSIFGKEGRIAQPKVCVFLVVCVWQSEGWTLRNEAFDGSGGEAGVEPMMAHDANVDLKNFRNGLPFKQNT